MPRQCHSVRRVKKRAVGRTLPFVVDDRFGHIPAFPAGSGRAVAEVDVLTVEPEAGVKAPELVQHRAAKQEEAAEQPVGGHRLGRLLVEVVVAALPFERREQPPQRRAADDARPRRSGSAAATARPRRAMPSMRGPATPQRGCPSANARSVAIAPGSGKNVRVAEHDELARRLGETTVRVRREPERTLVLEHACTPGERRRRCPGRCR